MVTNNGEGPLYAHLYESLDGSVPGNVSYLSVAPTSFIISPEDSINVCIAITADTLSPGVYYSYLMVTSNDPDESPYFLPIKVTVLNSTGSVIEGMLTNTEGNPIGKHGIVEVYSGSTLLQQVQTDGIGHFYISGLSPGNYDMRCYAYGYYPFWKRNVVNPSTGNYVKLMSVPSPTPTAEKVDFYGDTVNFKGYPVKVGDVITVYDPDGVFCGVYFVVCIT